MLETTEITPEDIIAWSLMSERVLSSSPEIIEKSGPQ